MDNDNATKLAQMLTNAMNRFGTSMQSLAEALRPIKSLPNQERTHHPGSKNKSKKRNKKRYLMAKKSQKINRDRIKGWHRT